MLLFKIIQVISTNAVEYADQFDGMVYSGIRFMGNEEIRRETGDMVCSIKIVSGGLNGVSKLKFIKTPAIMGEIEEYHNFGKEHVVKISFRTIFSHGFDFMVRQLIQPGDKVVAISEEELMGFEEVEKQRELLELLITLYLPSKRKEITGLLSMAFALQPASGDSRSFFNCDPFVPGNSNEFLYCYLDMDDLRPYLPEFITSNFAITFTTELLANEEITYCGNIRTAGLQSKPTKLQSIKVRPYQDLPPLDSPFIERLQFSKHAKRKYETIYDFFRDMVIGEDTGVRLFGYPIAIQEGVEFTCSQKVDAANPVNHHRLTSWRLCIQIAGSEYESDFHRVLSDGLIYLMMKPGSSEIDISSLTLCTIVQYD